MKKNIVLTGFMATGKTKISKALSKISGMTVVDTDEEIIKREGRSINDIFSYSGEPYFREIEKKVVSELAHQEGIIISTGGGTVLDPENIEVLKENSVIFLLDAAFCVIAERIGKASATRPLLKDSSLEDIKKRFDERKPFYDRCDYKIPVSNEQRPEAFALQILQKFQELCREERKN